MVYRRLRHTLQASVIISLLKATNNDLLRPLECAINNGILGLATAFLLTPGIYVIREEDRGVATYQWIDVTEYEAFGEGNRREWSPLFCVTFLDKDRLTYPPTRKFFTDPIILNWVDHKMRCGKLPACFYVFMRTLALSLFYIIDTDVGIFQENINNPNYGTQNTSYGNIIYNINFSVSNNASNTDDLKCTGLLNWTLSPLMRNSICIFLIGLTLCSLSVNVIEYVISTRARKCCLMKTMDKKYKKTFIQYKVYRLLHDLTIFLIFLRAIFTLIGVGDPREDLIAYSRILTRTAAWWSLAYYMQLIPGADFFVIAIQSMIDIQAEFSLISAIYLGTYMQLFMLTINLNLKQGCVRQFGDVISATYNTFLATINMLDFTQFDINHVHQLYIIHTLYANLVGILLMNLLIALMSDRVREISKYKSIILPIQKLSVLLTMERQLQFFGRWYYKWMQRKVFVEHNGRLCIVRVVLKR